MIVNHAAVPGVATILDGTSVETTDTPSNMNLANGGRLVLAPGSSARIHSDHLILDRGGAELTGSASFHIQTTSFRVSGSSPAAHVQVLMQQTGHVHVEAIGGAAEVRNTQGLLVAKVQGSTALDLQTANTSSTHLAGTVRSHDGKFFLTDEVSHIGVELRGANLASVVGRRVDIVGSRLANVSASAGMSQVVAVSSTALALNDSGSSAEGPSPDPSPDPPPSPPPPPPPVSKGKKTALIVVGGAAVAGGTVGGLWAAGVIGGSTSVSQ
jgi:hypothetical protein